MNATLGPIANAKKIVPNEKMKTLIITLFFVSNLFAADVNKGKSFKETVNQGADNIDRETRKVIKKGKQVWNDKVINAPSKSSK